MWKSACVGVYQLLNFQSLFILPPSELLLWEMIVGHFLPTASRACLNTKWRHCRFSTFRIGPGIQTYLVNKIMDLLNFNNKPFKAQWLLYLPPGLTLKNVKRSIMLLCRLYRSQKKHKLFRWLAFITVTQSVYCAVRSECLNVIQASFWLLKALRINNSIQDVSTQVRLFGGEMLYSHHNIASNRSPILFLL